MQTVKYIYIFLLLVIIFILTSSLQLISSNALTYIGLVPVMCFSTFAFTFLPACSFVGKILEPILILLTNSKLNKTKLKGNNQFKKHIHPTLPCALLELDGMGVVINKKKTLNAKVH